MWEKNVTSRLGTWLLNDSFLSDKSYLWSTFNLITTLGKSYDLEASITLFLISRMMELTFESRASNDFWEVVHTELFDTRSFSWLISVLIIMIVRESSIYDLKSVWRRLVTWRKFIFDSKLEFRSKWNWAVLVLVKNACWWKFFINQHTENSSITFFTNITRLNSGIFTISHGWKFSNTDCLSF